MHRILIIPGENYPAHQAVMAEVFSKEDKMYQSVFLMRCNYCSHKKAKWNKSPVYLFSYFSKVKLLNKIKAYLCMDLRYAILIPRIVVKEKINIIQIRDLTFPLAVALVIKLFTGKKVIYQKSYPMEYSRIESAKNPSLKFQKFLLAARRADNFILHKLMRLCDAILPISKYMAYNLYNDYQIPYNLMHPFGMGYNFADFPSQPRKEQPVSSTCKVIYVGTLEKKRRFDILLHGIALLLKQLPEKQAEFEFVGGTDEEIAALQEIVDTLEINNSCTFSGYIKRAEVYRKIISSQIGISWFGTHVEYSDACPTKMMEYLANGVPILAVDSVFMHRDILDETQAGVLCKVEARDVADKLGELMTDYTGYKENAQKAIAYIEQHFSYPAMREEIRQLYDTI